MQKFVELVICHEYHLVYVLYDDLYLCPVGNCGSGWK